MSTKNTYNQVVVENLSNKYGYTPTYIRRCLRKDADGIMPDAIRKEYKEKVEQVNKVLNQ